MKYILLGTAAALAIGSASQAQVSFSKGVGSFSISALTEANDFVVFNPEFDLAFNAGSFGFQVSSGLEYITDFDNSLTLANFELHGYKTLGNGNKFGVFLASGVLFFSDSPTVGVEAIVGLGAIDVEASFGYAATSGTPFYQASVDVYLDVSSSLEVSAGYSSLFSDTGNSFSRASVGAAYAFGGSGYSVHAGYNFALDGGVSDSYSIGVSWEFGPNTDERLFGDRTLDFLALGVT